MPDVRPHADLALETRHWKGAAKILPSTCGGNTSIFIVRMRNGLTTIVQFTFTLNPDIADMSAHKMEYECTPSHANRADFGSIT